MIKHLYILFLLLGFLFSIPASGLKFTTTQPDGTILEIIPRGDEWQGWVELESGHTIAKDKDGYWKYITGYKSGAYQFTTIRADYSPPNNLVPHIKPPRQDMDVEHKPINLKNLRFTTFNVPFLLIDYPDMPNTYSQQELDNVLNQEGYTGPMGQTGSFRDFYIENSYGQFIANSVTIGWFTASEDHHVYGDGAPNGYAMVHEMIGQAIDEAEAQGVDWSQFDNDGDGYVDALNIIHAGPGAEEGNSTYIWSHKWSLNPNYGSYGDQSRYYDGVWINNYTINPEKQSLGYDGNPGIVHIGVISHEFGHALGLPDLYDIDYSSDGIGTWGLMSGGSWGGNGSSPWYPSHYCTWSKVTLGWVDPIDIDDPQITISDIENVEFTPLIYRMKGYQDGSEYFLFENRQRVGFDQTIKQTGMLVWHIDESIGGYSNNDNTNDWHRRVDVEQADGTYGLNNGYNGGDSGDPWPGSSGNMSFSYDTTPNSRYYTGESSGVTVKDITENNGLVSATFRMLPNMVQDEIIFLENTGDGDGIPNPGEEGNLSINIYNPSPYLISNLSGVLFMNDSYINPLDEQIYFSDSQPYESALGLSDVIVSVSPEAPLGEHTVGLQLFGTIDGEDFYQELSIAFAVSIDQLGFPKNLVDENENLDFRTILTSPLMGDINSDGIQDIIVGDNTGLVSVYDVLGNELIDQIWPFDVESKVYASPSIADMDGDSYNEVVVATKSNGLFVIDSETGDFLHIDIDEFIVSTPSISNFDDDEDLEVAFCTLQSGMLHIVNLDGSYVDNFPVFLNEKVYGDLAVGDFNFNDLSDVVVATDSGNIFLILDDGSIASGFPFTGDDKFRAGASLIDIDLDNTPEIIIGSDAGTVYMLDANGVPYFETSIGESIRNSPALSIQDASLNIVFSTEEGNIYYLDEYGEIKFFRETGKGSLHSPVLSDFDSNGAVDAVVASESGSVNIVSDNLVFDSYFPLVFNSEIINNAPLVSDIDNDGDLEIIFGYGNYLHSLDIKLQGSQMQWAIHRSDFQRTGLLIHSSDFYILGDVNFDENLNISDVIILVLLTLEPQSGGLVQKGVADLNDDQTIDILDIILLVEQIVS